MKGVLVKVSPPFFQDCMDKMKRGVFITFWVELGEKKKLKQFFIHEEIAASQKFSNDFSTLLLANEGYTIEFGSISSSTVKGLGAMAFSIRNIDFPERTVTEEMQKFEDE